MIDAKIIGGSFVVAGLQTRSFALSPPYRSRNRWV
jgi:hypothetical protein